MSAALNTKAARVLMVVLGTGLAAGRAPAQGCANHLVVSGLYTLPGNATYDCVTILSGASLHTSIYTLTVTGAGGLNCAGDLWVEFASALVLVGGGTSTVDGSIQLLGSGSSLLIAAESCTISGGGRIKGWLPGVAIGIQRGSTFINDATVEGQLSVIPFGPAGVAKFGNYGAVRATTGTIIIGSTLDLTDAPGALWASDGLASSLQFNTGAQDLAGTIGLYRAGRIILLGTVSTRGPLDYTVGLISIPLPLVSLTFGKDNCDSPHPPLPNPIQGPAALPVVCP